MNINTIIFGGGFAVWLVFILFGPIMGVPVMFVYMYAIFNKITGGRQAQNQQYEEYIAELEEENRRLKERQKFFE
ncbi:hypothetical protein K3L72_07150 [Bacillus altitudinis]|uniref:hypothetical protein n=1 Tax=Bacillus TaxID=1386 RepID=UPI000260A5FE|nr:MULTISPECIES: hypothetical protein [Bacillus]NQW95320.1 hypothetical protein [Bacillus stratosphericus]EIL85357.1 hypothetical protein BAME_13800 [Bacillus sp. M 2-6]MCW4357548.1 hypothetical protein [Bacillus altitudinis]MEC0472823.1 hypothetical protein [Bacillus altitudinis]NOL34824.1 hypothetical protein [Bacillus altitudinis]